MNELLITPLMEQQMFDDWCPYSGNPDPRTVWSAAIQAVNGIHLTASQPKEPVAYLVTGPYEKTAFSDIGSANAYCRGLNKGFDTDAYIVSPLYTTPPQRKPLTRAVLWKLWCDAKFESTGFFWLVFARAIEAAHGIKD